VEKQMEDAKTESGRAYGDEGDDRVQECICRPSPSTHAWINIEICRSGWSSSISIRMHPKAECRMGRKEILCDAGVCLDPDGIQTVEFAQVRSRPTECQCPESLSALPQTVELVRPLSTRRDFLQSASCLVPSFFVPTTLPRQRFQAGVIPVGKTTVANGSAEVVAYCDEVARLGFHRYEVNNTRASIAQSYVDKIPEFNEQMAMRHLTLVGLAQYSRAEQQDKLAELLEQHMLIGRFLSGVGGKYITHMLAPGAILNESPESAYENVDVKIWARNANEIGRRLFDQWGIKLGYHPLRAEVTGELYKHFLDLTDDRSVFLIADIGHLAAGGADSIEVCRLYRQRLIAVHLKDYSPTPSQEKGTKAGNVPFGRGIVNIAGVVAELERTKFKGWVLGESGGTNLAMRDYMVRSLRITL
jgi:inosose dehydratase